MVNNDDQMLTVREVTQLLHVHGNTLRRWSDLGIVKAYRIGPRGDRRFRTEDIAGLLLEEDKGVLAGLLLENNKSILIHHPVSQHGKSHSVFSRPILHALSVKQSLVA